MSMTINHADHLNPEAQASLLTTHITDLSNKLQHDLGHTTRKNVLLEIRELRRSLATLEYELIDQCEGSQGDAC